MMYRTFLSFLVDMDAVSRSGECSEFKGQVMFFFCTQAIEQEHFSLELTERCRFIVLMQMMNHFLMLYMAVILCSRIYIRHMVSTVTFPVGTSWQC